jgi:hypothetical protein
MALVIIPKDMRCLACEGRLIEHPGKGDGAPEHLETSYMCSNPTCKYSGYCLTCVKNGMWLIQMNDELGPDTESREERWV